MNPRSATAFRLGGADRYEAEADRNQKKILRALSGLGGTPRLEVSRELGRSRIRRSAIYPETDLGSGVGGAGDGGTRGTSRVRIRKLHVVSRSLAVRRSAKGPTRGPDMEFAREIGRSQGQPLSGPARDQLERMFGRSLQGVRVHADGAAARAARAIAAHAFSIGGDVYFGAGQLAPETPSGMALLGHEVTHVLQGGGVVRAKLRDQARVAPSLPKDLESVLGASRGRPLPASLRAYFEPAFGATLDTVRIHTDGPAATACRDLGAMAFALGESIYFAPGAYRPDTVAGRALLAHELTHVVQARGSAPGPARAGRPKAPAEGEADTNQRLVARAIARGEAPGRLRATKGGGIAERVIRRSAFSEFLADNKRFWEEAAVSGFQQGGFFGNLKGGLSTVAAIVNDPAYVARQTKAYAVGIGAGAYEGAKGMVNMVLHPIETVEGIYKLIVHFDQTKEFLKRKVELMVSHASSDPELFARECGELVGQIEVALVGPKVIGGSREVVGALRSLKNLRAVPGRTLWYYSTAEDAAKIARSSQIGIEGRAAFATGLDPLLGFRNTVAGWLARNLATGGRLHVDVLRQAGRFRFDWSLNPKLLNFGPYKLTAEWRAGFTTATQFTGGTFRPLVMTACESWILRFGKALGFQYAAPDAQKVAILAQKLLSDPMGRAVFFEAADMAIGGGTAITLGGIQVPLSEIEKTDWSTVRSDPAVQSVIVPLRKRRGLSRFEDGDPELARRARTILARRGRPIGVSLDLTTKNAIEAALGHPLGEVRLHTGPLATELARATEAQALTIGRDVFLPRGMDLGTPEGLGLLAHEVTHVAQGQPATPRGSPAALGAFSGPEAMETVARRVEARFAAFGASGSGGPGRGWAATAALDPVVREAPGPIAVVGPGPAAAGPAAAPAPARPVATTPATPPVGASVHRSVEADLDDPRARSLDPELAYVLTPGLSQEALLEVATERCLDLLKEDLAHDAERREELHWSENLPAP